MFVNTDNVWMCCGSKQAGEKAMRLFGGRFTNIILILMLLVCVGFADNDIASNIPKDWPEECVPEFCKKPGFGQCGNGHSPCHKINQKFNGGYFFKDTNIWIVTPDFAKTFGMEDMYISSELTGVEAIAYRVETHNTMCGLGGNENSCKTNERGVLDVYIDEKKTPLPWVYPSQMADWYREYTSINWLETKKEYRKAPIPVSDSFIPNKLAQYGRLHPFADPKTKHEAAYFQDLNDNDDWQAIVSILGYKRSAIEGLTVISFFYRVSTDGMNRDKPRTFRLLSNFKHTLGSKTKDTKEFHTFYIPVDFIKKIEEVDKASEAKNAAFFKQLFENMKKNKQPQTSKGE